MSYKDANANPKYKKYKTEYDKNYYQKNKERIKARANKYRADNHDAIRKYERDPVLVEKKVLARHGISREEYDRMLEKQEYVCAICKTDGGIQTRKTTGLRKLDVDHCHKTGVIRGLLCMRCNIRLGVYENHGEKMRAYLGKYGTGSQA